MPKVFQENRIFVIAEAGVNHNGSMEIARQLIDAAAESMADAVKFQTWKTENIATAWAEKAPYQKLTTGENENQFDMLKKLELSYSEFSELKNYATERRIIFISTPDEEESVDFLDSIEVPFFKIGSGEINNLSFLRHVAEKARPIVLSTGMSTLGEVERAAAIIREVQAAKGVAGLQLGGSIIPPLTLLHCVSSYPAPAAESNLRAMKTMSMAFGVPVGYSDHSETPAVTVAAVALGATIIEKHFTLDRKMPGPDHSSSFDPGQFKELVQAIRIVEMSLGDGVKRVMPSEGSIRGLVRKNLVAAYDIPADTVITDGLIAAKRSSRGISAEWREALIGRRTTRFVKKDEGLELELLS